MKEFKNNIKVKLSKALTISIATAMLAVPALNTVPIWASSTSPAAQRVDSAIRAMAGGETTEGTQAEADALSSATYYKKANWEARIRDKSRWKVEDSQNLVRVSGSDPVEMNDIDYDGMFIDANGRYVIRLVYKEKSQALSAVWHRALINFGDLEKFIDFDLSYVLGKDGKTQYKFEDVKNIVGKGFDLRSATGDRTNNRKNLPINLVLNEGVELKTLGQDNYIVQMRLTDGKYEKVYAYAPKGTSMDYSTYTKTTSVDLVDKLGTLFIKGGQQSDGKNATNQEFFMSEFIANPEQYSDKSNLGIIRTQYMGQTNPIVRDTVGGQPMAFTQVFDANLVKYLKADTKGNVAYVNVLTNNREVSTYSKNFGIKSENINYSADEKLAYIVIGTKDFKKEGVKVVTVPNLDQYVMLSGFYITAIDYVIDKGKFEDTFAGRTQGIDATRKLNYTMMSGWTNPNTDGWVIYEKDYANEYVVPEGESYLIDTTETPTGGQIMIQVGGDQAILRKPQGYYNGYVTGDGANDYIEEYAKGVYKFTLREGATILPGKKLRVYMPYTPSHEKAVNFLEVHNGTKLNEGAATLTLQNDRNINMHLYKKGAGSYKLKYTLKEGDKASELEFKKGVLWNYKDKDGVLTGASNRATLSTGGNFYIDTTRLKPGADIFVESYDERGNEIPEQKSWFKYVPLTKSQDNVKLLTWTDHSDKKSVLSVNKSLYTPYQVLFTNDYSDGTDDFYKNPKVLPANNEDFKKDTKEFVGYTKYDGGKVRTLYVTGFNKGLIAKVQAAEDEYNDKGELTTNNSKQITIPKNNIFDPHFIGESKEYKAYEYKVDLTKMLPYHSEDKTETKLELLKDMKFVSTASDGSSLPSDLYETRVRARVLFDANTGKLADGKDKEVRIVPDNVKFRYREGYKANGFEGANVNIKTGDKFPEAPKLTGKNFLGWVTEEGKTKLQNKAVVTADEFNALTKDQIFTADTPVDKHLVVYAIYSEETAVTFDANEGEFGDGKDTTTVKVDNGSVAKPTDPTRDGYKFLGWAATKDGEVDANILNDVTAPKTVYAVWEKTDKTSLNLTAPTPVKVKDTKSLTSDEQEKVEAAVIAANQGLNLTPADVVVDDDGTVTVTKNGKTGRLTPEQTVKQKEVHNEFNPPKEPVPVDKIGHLTNEEIAEIKKAVQDANPDRNLKDEEITVKPDGTVEIKQGGKVGTIDADKTVVQKDTILDLNKPSKKVEVKNPANLTQGEKDEVVEKVKDANPTLTNPTVDVDSKGNVTVKDGNKTGTLKAKDTVTPFTREGKTLNPPTNKVKVGDTNKLTEQEKQEVRDAIKAANPELGFTDDEIQVDSDGTVTVPMGESDGSIPGTDTVEEATEADKTIKLVAPAKTPVADKNRLTEEEKKAVIAAVLANNDGLGLTDNDIKVANDGSVTVEKNGKTGQLSQADTVVEKLKKPILRAAKDGSVTVKPADDNANVLEVKYTPAGSNDETTLTATFKEVEDADGNKKFKWTLPEGTDASITIDEDTGEITLPANKVKTGEAVKAIAKADDGAKSDEVTINSKDQEAPEAPTVKSNGEGGVTVTPPTDQDTKSVNITYKDQDGHEQTLVATKGDDGNWTLPAGTDPSIKIDETTGAVTLPKEKIKAGEKVTATAKDANNNESVAGEATPVDKIELQKEADKNNNDAIKNSDKYKNAEQTKKDAYDAALAKAKEVLAKKDATQEEVNEAKKALEEAEQALDGTTKPADELKDPAKVAVKDKTNLSTDEKAAIKKAVMDANSGLTEEQIEVDNEGNVTVTKAGEQPKTIAKDKTITTDVKLPAITEVANKSNLDETEKGKVKAAVIAANQGLTEDQIEVKADGTVVVKGTDGKETIIPASSVVKEKAQVPGAPKAPAVKANDDGTVSVTPPADDDLESVTIKYTDPQGHKKTVTATKDGNGWKFNPADADFRVDGNGNIVIPADQVKPGTEVIAKAKNNAGTESTEGKAKVAILADKYAPEYTGADGAVGTKSTITGPNFTDKDGKPATKPDGTTFELGQGAPQGASVDANGTVTYTPIAADEGKEIKIPVVVKYSDGSKDNVEAKITVVDIKAPAAPKVEAKDDGSVTVTPPADADTKKVEVTYTPEGSDQEVTVTATKDANGKWSVPEGSDVSVNPDTGMIKIPADKVKDNTEVSAVAKDANNNASTATADSKANAKTPSTPGAEKPAAPTVKANNDGSVTVTPPTDDNIEMLAISFFNAAGELEEFEVKKENGKWTLPAGIDTAITVDTTTGVVTIPADKVRDGSTVTAKAKAGDKVSEPGTATTPSDAINAPMVRVTVGDKNNLTPAEKMAVEKAVRDANRNLPAGVDIVVGNDGTVTIKKGNVVLGIIPGSKTVVEEIRSGGHFYEPSPGYLGNYVPKHEEPKKVEKKEEPKKEEKAEPRRLEAFRWYVRGNEHGEFMPKKGMTRAEVAQIFVRALGYDKTVVGSNVVEFKDVKANAWYHDAVVKTAAAGIFKGSDVGTFMPTREITRAELIATIARFQKLDTKAGNTMNLPQNHWAIALVEAAYQEGWLDIYEKGLVKFDADGVITREEVVTILNRAFGRQADANYIDNNASRLYNFKDVDKSLWSYYEILTAANTYVVGDGWADHSNVDSNYEIDNVKWDMPLLDNDVVEQVKFQR